MKKISIVVPVYFNELNLNDTIPQLLLLEEGLPHYNLELVFVDDGSRDRSLEILLDFQKQYPKQIKVVKLTRNFGSMAAIQAGLCIAQGDCVGMISADLQDPPELFLQMVKEWENGTKAVFAVRQDREESASQKLFAQVYYGLVRKFAITSYPDGGFDFFLIDRQVVDEVNKVHEKNTHIMALIFWLGYQAALIPYTRRARKEGKSRWTLKKKYKLFIDTFVSFSYFPIQLLSMLGFLVAGAAFIYGCFIFFFWLIYGIEVRGWTPIMILLTMTAGIQMTMIGVLGEYLWRTFDESRKRPLFVVDEVYEQPPALDLENEFETLSELERI
jgi:polyisoprenyl-phosphate glycosyltransferase